MALQLKNNNDGVNTDYYNNDMAGSREAGEEKTWVASVRNLMKSMKLTAQQAVEALAVPMELRQKVLKQI